MRWGSAVHYYYSSWSIAHSPWPRLFFFVNYARFLRLPFWPDLFFSRLYILLDSLCAPPPSQSKSRHLFDKLSLSYSTPATLSREMATVRSWFCSLVSCSLRHATARHRGGARAPGYPRPWPYTDGRAISACPKTREKCFYSEARTEQTLFQNDGCILLYTAGIVWTFSKQILWKHLIRNIGFCFI